MTLNRRFIVLCLSAMPLGSLMAQSPANKFQPYTFEWPAANASRLASGAPGPGYWQQRADYKITATLDENARSLKGAETVTYFNQSPHTLTYLWVQVDQESRKPGACAASWQPSQDPAEGGAPGHSFNGAHQIEYVRDAQGKNLSYQIVETNMRIQLPAPLTAGQKFVFSVAWNYKINDATIEGRSGYEKFGDGNDIFEMAQWYPRMCVYDDTKGWQNQPFYGPAEFALEFGNYDVSVTVPSDHIVSGTGTLTNANDVLTPDQRSRLEQARSKPGQITMIVTADEAKKAMASRSAQTRTWQFHADNVRDFAWASSRRYIWDASAVDIGGKRITAQSFYPPEAVGVWDKYATHAVMHALTVYSKHSVDYPYPQASAVNGPVWGMEYPMVAFCGGRPDPYMGVSEEICRSTISVIIHEVGHNFFPMIINSDERRWAWMDEGLNSFLQYLTEQEWEAGYPSRRGFPDNYGATFAFYAHNPIMTNPESIMAQGKTTYEKTAVGLNILRETVMGRTDFDFAFKEYCTRWAFKHPEPWDFFRTLSDAGGHDLGWFWRCWFYDAKPVDISLVKATIYEPGNDEDSAAEAVMSLPSPYIGEIRNKTEIPQTYLDKHPDLAATPPGADEIEGEEGEFVGEIEWDDVGITGDGGEVNGTLVHFEIRNKGIPMPVPVAVIFTDGTQEVTRLPAQIWMRGDSTFTRTLRFDKPVSGVLLDPYRELPDIDRTDNFVMPERKGM